ncbi:transporter [Lithospermum erythrorhizon]|uniref:Transporter n=1 Tax=Lithospermum erythrorhizon TaxID=34254 RepID=A0AAV3RKQ2_LITER
MEPELFSNDLLLCRKKTPIHPLGIFYGHDPLDFTFTLLLFDILLVIFVARLVRIILKPIGQPRIVSDILGGIIIGPSVFGRNKRYQEYVFPDSAKFMIRNFAILGFMYFVFITGVKMDLSVIFKAKKKHWYISTIGVAFPLLTSITVAICMRKYAEAEELRTFASLYGISTTIAITAFPVLYPVVRELNLLSSDIGRLALSLSVISDVIGMHGLVIFEAAKQGEGKSMAALWYTVSFFLVMAILVVGVRLAMDWIVKSTPEGKPVEEIYVVFILLGVCVAGFVTDMCGLAICNGPLWLGLAVPDGPPLGATIVEKCETFLMEIFMPFSFAYVGLVTDVSSMSGNWSILRPLFYMAFLGCITKVSAVLVTGHLTSMTFRDSLALALIMSIRGQVELIMFVHWMDLKVPPLAFNFSKCKNYC